MPTLTLKLSTLYADHHVIEVRALLNALPGVHLIYVSAAWQTAVLEFDATQTGTELIRQALRARGYTDEPLALPVSARTKTATDIASGPGAVPQFLEHVPERASPLGPCPGFEVRQPGDVHPADQ